MLSPVLITRRMMWFGFQVSPVAVEARLSSFGVESSLAAGFAPDALSQCGSLYHFMPDGQTIGLITS